MGTEGKPAYIAQTGQSARDRLALQHRVFAPGTEILLEMCKFKPDMQVLIVGCGCGDETVMIAEKMQSTGHIVALDRNLEQIDQAKKAVKEAGLSDRVSFLNKSIEDLSSEDGEYDLILCRFVIPHLLDPKSAISTLKNRLRCGGALASQEPIVSSCYAEPESPALTKYLALMVKFAAVNKLNFDIASTIPALFISCELITTEKTWQPKVLGADKNMVTMSAKECMPAIISSQLISEEAGSELIIAIEKEVVKPKDAILFQCVNVLTVGIKPPSP